MVHILIAEDAHMVRGALVALLNLEPDFTVVAEIGHGDEIVHTARRTRPDVALIDVGLPGTDGVTAAAELRATLPECRVLILTSTARPAVVRRTLDAGLEGLLLKDAPPDRLAAAVRDVMRGRRVFDQDMTLEALSLGSGVLTPRETEVLARAADGHDAGHIAAQLHLSAGTVRNYLTAIVTKLNARNRVDAIRMAREEGLI